MDNIIYTYELSVDYFLDKLKCSNDLIDSVLKNSRKIYMKCGSAFVLKSKTIKSFYLFTRPDNNISKYTATLYMYKGNDCIMYPINNIGSHIAKCKNHIRLEISNTQNNYYDPKINDKIILIMSNQKMVKIKFRREGTLLFDKDTKKFEHILVDKQIKRIYSYSDLQIECSH